MTETLTVPKLPQGLTLRAPTMEDAETVLELMIADEIAETGEADMTLEDLHQEWDWSKFNLDTDARLVFDGEKKLAAYAAVWYTQPVKNEMAVIIHPNQIDQELERYLITLNETRARQNIALTPPHARVTINRWLNANNSQAQRLIEEMGYHRERTFWHMAIEIPEMPPLPQLASGLTIRTFVSGQDNRGVFEAYEEAFQDHWGHLPVEFEEWERDRIKNETFDPTLWFLALDGNEIAGAALCRTFPNKGWVNTLFVRRPWRKSGVGLALLQHAFGEFYQRGESRVWLGVDASSLTNATRLYEKAGMHIARQYHFYQKILRDGEELSTQNL